MELSIIKDRFSVIEPYVKGKDVLDIGCVDARTGGEKKYKSTGLHIFLKGRAHFLMGVDSDKGGVIAMKNEGYNVTQADAERLNLGRRFDTVVAGEILEHLSNPGLFLESVKGHLNDGGTLIITTPNAFGITNFFRILRKNSIKVHGGHTCWYDPVTLAQLLGRHFFKVEEMFFSNKRKWYKRRYFFKLKYQIPKFFTMVRPYFSGTIIAVARKYG